MSADEKRAVNFTSASAAPATVPSAEEPDEEEIDFDSMCDDSSASHAAVQKLLEQRTQCTETAGSETDSTQTVGSAVDSKASTPALRTHTAVSTVRPDIDATADAANGGERKHEKLNSLDALPNSPMQLEAVKRLFFKDPFIEKKTHFFKEARACCCTLKPLNFLSSCRSSSILLRRGGTLQASRSTRVLACSLSAAVVHFLLPCLFAGAPTSTRKISRSSLSRQAA